MQSSPTPITLATRAAARARRLLAAALPGVALGLLGACAQDPGIVAPPAAPGADFMRRYVALGNSITAGYMSGGLDATTQAQAYPALLARAAGVDYHAPYLAGPGCAPQTNAVQAFAVAVGTATPAVPAGQPACVRVAPAQTGLNNVAVPGANSADPTGAAGSGANPLTTLILGGRTQVQRALEIAPTFVSVFIGSNDVLRAALVGDTTLATPLATFQARYDAMLLQLTADGGAADRRGLLIGVVDVTNVPAVFPAAVIVNDVGGFRTAYETQFLGAGRRLLVLDCPADTPSLVSLGLLLQIAQTAQSLPSGTSIPFACSPTPVPGVSPTPGTLGILDAAEIAALRARVAAYNAFIQQRAGAVRTAASPNGWAYHDPNATLTRLKATPGLINPVPVLTSPAAPFGTAISLDGIHPSALAHRELAADLVGLINRFYGSRLPHPRTANTR